MTAATPFSSGSPSSCQYALAGPAPATDPRVTPVRGDLADIALAGKLFVSHYVAPLEMAVRSPFAPLRKASRADAEQTSELLRGECFQVLEISGGWTWGYGAHDGYVGYLALADLGPVDEVPPLSPADGAEPVAAAETLVGTPYVWGGRGGAGIDCSGLVQTVFARAGHALPRDSDQQAALAGHPLGAGEPLQRGDLAFFPGHVAIVRDAETLIHASLEHHRVVIEPLAGVVARKGPATGFRRVP